MNKPSVFLPFWFLYKKEVGRFVRVIGQTIFTPVINSFLYLLIFGVSLGRSINMDSEYSYLAFLIPGLIMMSVLNNAYQNTASSIVTSKFHGDLQDLRTVPLSPIQIVWAYAFGGLSRGLLVGVITYIVGSIFYYVQEAGFLFPHSAIYLLAFLIIGGVSFAFLGISVSFWARNFDQMSAVSAFILLPLTYLGGVFYSIDILHPFWRQLSEFNPLLYFINGVRYGLIGVSDVSAPKALLVLVISMFFLLALALRSIHRGHYTRW